MASLLDPLPQMDLSLTETFKRLRDLLDDAIRDDRSDSLLLFGPTRYQLVDQVTKALPTDINILRLDGLYQSGIKELHLDGYSVIILFDLERWHRNQGFLYDLLQREGCFVLGLSERWDALDGLEKRVRSRHSLLTLFSGYLETEQNTHAEGLSLFLGVSLEEATSLQSLPLLSSELTAWSQDLTIHELFALMLIKLNITRKCRRQSFSFLLEEIHEEYRIAVMHMQFLQVMPISRSLLSLALEGLADKKVIVTEDADDAYALYRLCLIAPSMIDEIADQFENLPEWLTRFLREYSKQDKK